MYLSPFNSKYVPDQSGFDKSTYEIKCQSKGSKEVARSEQRRVLLKVLGMLDTTIVTFQHVTTKFFLDLFRLVQMSHRIRKHLLRRLNNNIYNNSF